MKLQQRHEFRIGEAVYYDTGDGQVEQMIVTALLSEPGYTYEYTLVRPESATCMCKKKYAFEHQLSRHYPIRTRKELYEKIGSEATKVIRRLRDAGKLTIDLPPR